MVVKQQIPAEVNLKFQLSAAQYLLEVKLFFFQPRFKGYTDGMKHERWYKNSHFLHQGRDSRKFLKVFLSIELGN